MRSRPDSDRAAREAAQELARQTHRSVEEAQAAYEIELAALRADAKVTAFLPVIAKREAKRRLLGR